MIYLGILLFVAFLIFSYKYLSSVSYYASTTTTEKNYDDEVIKMVTAEQFLEIFHSSNINWTIDEEYRKSIFSEDHNSQIHVNAVFQIHGVCYIFDCAKSYNKVVKELKKEITIIHAKAYLIA